MEEFTLRMDKKQALNLLMLLDEANNHMPLNEEKQKVCEALMKELKSFVVGKEE